MQSGRTRTTWPLLLLSLCIALSACGRPAGADGPIDGARAMAHVQKFVSFGARPFGSEALGKTADYIGAEIDKLGLKLQRHEQMHAQEKRLMRNLYCQIDGADPDNGPILMIGAHYDTKITEGCDEWTHDGPFLGAIDGGGGPAVLIELARAIKALPEKLECNVWLYWIDAEESIDWTWNTKRALLGSKAFCDWLSAEKILPRIKAFVLLDLIGSKNFKIDRDGYSTKQLLDLFEEAGKRIGIGNIMYAARTAIGDDHQNFIDRGVPSVLLIDFDYRIPAHLQDLEPGQRPHLDDRYEAWWHTQDDDVAQMDSDSLAIAGNLVMAALPDLEAFVTKKKGK